MLLGESVILLARPYIRKNNGNYSLRSKISELVIMLFSILFSIATDFFVMLLSLRRVIPKTLMPREVCLLHELEKSLEPFLVFFFFFFEVLLFSISFLPCSFKTLFLFKFHLLLSAFVLSDILFLLSFYFLNEISIKLSMVLKMF